MDVAVVNRQRSRRVAQAPLSGFMRRVSRRMPPDGPASLAICLVSDRRMRELNRQFRDLDQATDVLSFPDGEADRDTGERYLGDIVISVACAARQARERGHSLSRELKLLALHGYLHLLGYDHETDKGRMMRLQRRLERELLPLRPRAGAS